MRILTVLVLSAALTTSAAAQRGGFAGGGHMGGGTHMGGGGHFGAGGNGPAPAFRSPLPSFDQPRGRFAFGRSGYGNGGRFNRYGPYGSFWPLFGDYDLGDYDLNDLYASGYPVASQPPMIPLQDALAMMNSRNNTGASDYERQATLAEPLMIELQNGHYVQVNTAAVGGEAQPFRASPNEAAAEDSRDATQPHAGPMIAARTTNDLAPVTLIFRDGHTEQVRDYTIADGTLYARGDFYTDGYWNKQIDLSSLNLPQTLQANAEHGVNFVLPSSPNEVIARF
jgi:hypothetical protein